MLSSLQLRWGRLPSVLHDEAPWQHLMTKRFVVQGRSRVIAFLSPELVDHVARSYEQCKLQTTQLVRCGQAGTASLLIEAGVDVNHMADGDITAIKLAGQYNHRTPLPLTLQKFNPVLLREHNLHRAHVQHHCEACFTWRQTEKQNCTSTQSQQ
eukprot:5220744-Amphidinium_carterae.1